MVAACVLAAALAVGLYRFDRRQPLVVQEQSAIREQPTAPEIENIQSQAPAAQPHKIATRRPLAPPTRHEIVSQPAPPPPTTPPPAEQPQPTEQVVLEPAPLVAATQPLVKTKTFVPPPIDHSIPFLRDLSPELQMQLPKLKLSGQTYSQVAKNRMIIINNKILHEGQEVDDDLRLIKITWSTVVLDYRGIRFQIRASR